MTMNKVVPLYLALLAFHILHVFEEIWGRFWIMNQVFGLGLFLVVNWMLVCIPLAIFHFLWRGNRAARWLAMIYAVVMILNGVGHNVTTIVTGRYFGGFAGGISGIGLIVTGIPLLYQLRAVRPA